MGPEEREEAVGASRHALLETLHLARRADRTLAEAYRLLSLDPEDFSAHYYAVLALIELGRRDEAKEHLARLSASQPDSMGTRFAAARYHLDAEDWRALARETAEGMRVAPEVAAFHHYAAIASLGRFRVGEAKRHIARARSLDPDDADIANLYITVHGLGETSAADGLRRLDAYVEALRLDPANAGLHHSMGRVCLEELEDPAAAEDHFREALRLDPTNRLYQGDLFEAVAQRSLVYRTFSIPSRTFAWLAAIARVVVAQPWRLILLLFAFKVVIAYLVWLALVTLVLWPGGKVYEWLLVSEVRDAASLTDTGLRLHSRLRRLPRWLRFLFFLGTNALLWIGLFAALGMPAGAGLILLSGFAGFHFLCLALCRAVRRGRTRRAARRSPAA